MGALEFLLCLMFFILIDAGFHFLKTGYFFVEPKEDEPIK
jgi:hypothetical protein